MKKLQFKLQYQQLYIKVSVLLMQLQVLPVLPLNFSTDIMVVPTAYSNVALSFW